MKAQRAPKAKRKQGDSTDAATGTLATAEGEQSEDEYEDDVVDGDRVDAEASEGTAGSSLSKSVNTPGAPGASSGQDSLVTPSPAPSATTGGQSSTLKTTETPLSKPAPVPAVAPSTTAPRSSTAHNNTKPKSVKKKGGLSGFFLACLPCGGSNAHDDRPPSRPATTSAPTSNPPAAMREKVDPVMNEKVQDSTTSTAKTTITPSGTTDLSAAEKDLAVAPATAAPSPSGVELPREETEGVTSGAVMAPGKDIAGTPGKTRRRRSGKQPESIITSVPEPGAVQESSEEGSDESDEEEEEDEEQNLIARGGVGIPIGEVSSRVRRRRDRELICFPCAQDGLPHPLLDELAPDLKGRKCLVLDLDETLVHSSFKVSDAQSTLSTLG